MDQEVTSIDYRELFFKQKIWQFTQTFYAIKDYINVYKGYIYINYQHKNEEYIDFIVEMVGFGFTREEVDSAIIDYLTEEESKDNETSPL